MNDMHGATTKKGGSRFHITEPRGLSHSFHFVYICVRPSFICFSLQLYNKILRRRRAVCSWKFGCLVKTVDNGLPRFRLIPRRKVRIILTVWLFFRWRSINFLSFLQRYQNECLFRDTPFACMFVCCFCFLEKILCSHLGKNDNTQAKVSWEKIINARTSKKVDWHN